MPGFMLTASQQPPTGRLHLLHGPVKVILVEQSETEVLDAAAVSCLFA